MRRIVLVLAVALGWGLTGPSALSRAGDPAPTSPVPPVVGEIPLRSGLILTGPLGMAARSPVHTDPIEARIVAGTWAPPKEGEEVVLPDGTKKAWAKVEASADGSFPADILKPGTYLFVTVPSDAERVMLLHAVGNDFVYVNGELRPGDVYSYGWLRLPVLLEKGDNSFLFRASRGRMKATLSLPPAEVFLSADDATLPSVEFTKTGTGEAAQPAQSGIVVVNTRAVPVAPRLRTNGPSGGVVRAASVPALSLRKVPVELDREPGGDAATVTRKIEVLSEEGVDARQAIELTMPVVRERGAVRDRTFVSDIDGSVQYYAVRPATGPSFRRSEPAVLLTLHGASVEARGQAGAYAPKSWLTVVAPTNRRPFGFDWEDWGRMDAMEVLAEETSERRYRESPQVYLTGHSMGGHGTWQIGVTYPDRFAAIGPSAGWISFWSYGGAPKTEPKDDVERMLRRAANPSDTLALASNLASLGVYVLHGDADDNVPVSEARTMTEHLKSFHRDFVLHEQKGAGHWWDLPEEPGAECVDWPPMFDFLARHAIPPVESVRDVDFVTADPGISSTCRWAAIDAQSHPRVPSRVRLRYDPGRRRFSGTTENVLRLHLEASALTEEGHPVVVDLDGTALPEVEWKRPGLWLERSAAGWRPVPPPEDSVKRAARCGPFKAAFDHRFALVYGTKGTPEENAWALAKVRFDSEVWYYRANGSVDVIADTDLDLAGTRDRNLILYGNADTNSAWEPLLKDSPVQVRRGSLKVGPKGWKGDDLACLFIRPKPGSSGTSVGVVAGSGLPGMRLCDRMPYFVSGIHFPDVTVLRADMLTKGAEGVRGTGFFGPDWSVDSGDWAWRD